MSKGSEARRVQDRHSAPSQIVAKANLSQICSRFKSKSKQILEVGTYPFVNLLQSTIELNTNPVMAKIKICERAIQA